MADPVQPPAPGIFPTGNVVNDFVNFADNAGAFFSGQGGFVNASDAVGATATDFVASPSKAVGDVGAAGSEVASGITGAIGSAVSNVTEPFLIIGGLGLLAFALYSRKRR